ncbi:MAG TPA: hypothetical protein VGD71_33955 [Kribbella sp.]|jgi:hypothetical protein
MALFKDQRARLAAEEARLKAEMEERLEARQKEREEAEFRESPVGKARASYERGDFLFQLSLDIEDIAAHVVAMENAYTERKATDVSEILNSVRIEGWNFHSFSTTFVNEGEVSRDKFLSTGQQVAVRGRIVGTYVFTRKPGNERVGPVACQNSMLGR